MVRFAEQEPPSGASKSWRLLYWIFRLNGHYQQHHAHLSPESITQLQLMTALFRAIGPESPSMTALNKVE